MPKETFAWMNNHHGLKTKVHRNGALSIKHSKSDSMEQFECLTNLSFLVCILGSSFLLQKPNTQKIKEKILKTIIVSRIFISVGPSGGIYAGALPRLKSLALPFRSRSNARCSKLHRSFSRRSRLHGFKSPRFKRIEKERGQVFRLSLLLFMDQTFGTATFSSFFSSFLPSPSAAFGPSGLGASGPFALAFFFASASLSMADVFCASFFFASS